VSEPKIKPAITGAEAEEKLLADLQQDVLEGKPRAQEMLDDFHATKARVGHDFVEWSYYKIYLEAERKNLPHNDGSSRWSDYVRTGVWVRGY
jgi:hypothetical protein